MNLSHYTQRFPRTLREAFQRHWTEQITAPRHARYPMERTKPTLLERLHAWVWRIRP